MSELSVRGYMILSCLDFLEAAYDAPKRQTIFASLPPEVLKDRAQYDKMGWYPRDFICAYYKAIAGLSENDEAKVYESLVECGRWMAQNATNSFLRLLMRIMTPAVFAKKAPDFWARDNRCGRMDVDISHVQDKQMIVRLHDVEGYVHAAPIAIGFGSFAMQAMGVQDLRVKQLEWSLATPSPAECRFDFSWK